jgi:hypothetical protein
MDSNQLSHLAVRTLIDNIRRVANTRLMMLDSINPDEWYNMTANRIGNEPLMRILLYSTLVMYRNQIYIHEVLCEDPELMHRAMSISDMTLYYQQYPQ